MNLKHLFLVTMCQGGKYDLKSLFKELKQFNILKENNLFAYGQVDVGGYGVVWDDKIDLFADEICDITIKLFIFLKYCYRIFYIGNYIFFRGHKNTSIGEFLWRLEKLIFQILKTY